MGNRSEDFDSIGRPSTSGEMVARSRLDSIGASSGREGVLMVMNDHWIGIDRIVRKHSPARVAPNDLAFVRFVLEFGLERLGRRRVRLAE